MAKRVPRFFISPIAAGTEEALIEGAEARHACKVLRLKVGDPIIVFDGTGQQYQARVRQLEKYCLRATLGAPLAVQTESSLDLALAQGYLKDKKMDMLVRHLTELGVRRWIPFMAERSVPAPTALRLQSRLERWQKISREAVKQCRRSHPMNIEPVGAFEAVLKLAAPYDLKLIFWEKASSMLYPDMFGETMPGKIFVMVGPEGGFESFEVEAAQLHGFRAVAMGPRILRAETATLTACSLVQYVFGDMGENCP